jgi:hypothetical protein
MTLRKAVLYAESVPAMRDPENVHQGLNNMLSCLLYHWLLLN